MRGGGGETIRAVAVPVRAFLKRHLKYVLHEPKELFWNFRYVTRETALVRRLEPDVLLVRDHLLTASCLVVARRLGLPLVLELNSPAYESHLYLDEYLHVPLVGEWMEGLKTRGADAVTVVSSRLKAVLVDRYRVPPRKVSVVPNGADTTRFHPGLMADASLQWPLDTGPIVGFTGSFRKWHGTGFLARVVQEVARTRPRTGFLLVGDGPEWRAVKEALTDLGERVVMTGAVAHDRVPGLTAAFDVGLMPESNDYGSPLKVLEWMAAGRAIVAPAYAPLADVIESGREGLLFPPRDLAACVRDVVHLIDDPPFRLELGRAAADRAAHSLTWVDNARRVLAACEQAIAAR